MCTVRPFAGWRSHSIWQRHRHRRYHDCRHNWYHRWAFHEPGARLHVRDSEERGDLFILSLIWPLPSVFVTSYVVMYSLLCLEPESRFLQLKKRFAGTATSAPPSTFRCFQRIYELYRRPTSVDQRASSLPSSTVLNHIDLVIA